ADYLLEKSLLSELGDLLLKEESYWHQKSREIWLKDGDQNTKFFHASVKARRNSNYISAIKQPDDSWISSQIAIKEEVVSFFQKLLTGETLSSLASQSSLLEKIPKLVNDVDNESLLSPFSLEEIQIVVFSMARDKAPALDGFP
ncbi:hypothetical protein KI387_037990, partial [Taxus chinensis]